MEFDNNRSKYQCAKCNDIIQSMHRHDFKYCECKAIAVDGGKEYTKLSGKFEDIIEIEPKEVNITLTYDQYKRLNKIIKKPELIDYLEPEMLDFLEVLEFGAKKYGKNNWLETGTNASLLHRYKSAMGHIARAVFSDEKYDNESLLHHMAHGTTNILMLYVMQMRKINW